MKNLIRVVALLAVMTGLCEATTLSGTIKNPDNTNAVGTLYMRLANPGSLQTTGSCGGPAQIIGGPNTRDIIISVPAGTVSGTILGNDCILPGNTYYIVRFVSSTGTILFSDNWYVFGTTLDVGTLVSTSTVGVAFSGAVLLSPQLNADQAIAGNLLPNGTRNLGSGVAPWAGFFSTIATNSLATLNSLSVSTTSTFGGASTFTGNAQFNGNLTGATGKALSGFDSLTSAIFKSTSGTVAGTGTIRLGSTDVVNASNGVGTDYSLITVAGGAFTIGSDSLSSATTAAGSWNFSQIVAFGAGFSVGGDSITSGARFYISHFFPGALTSTWTGGHEFLPKSITVQRVHVNTKAGPSGCGVNAVIRVTDGTTNIDTTVNATSVDNNPGSIAMLSGATLTWSVQTAATGCGTNPSDANVVIQYKLN